MMMIDNNFYILDLRIWCLFSFHTYIKTCHLLLALIEEFTNYLVGGYLFCFALLRFVCHFLHNLNSCIRTESNFLWTVGAG